jgi:N-ethylmaleimide reductase
MVDVPVPAELTIAQIDGTVAAFTDAARGAVAAGFDGVEVHGGNGFLINQFLAACANHRSDAYGGSVVNRIRFAIKVVDAVACAIGAERTALRISPWSDWFGIEPGDDDVVYPELVRALPPDLAYLHIREVRDRPLTARLRRMWAGPLMLNPHPAGEDPVSPESAQQALDEGVADLISFASMYLANPDLPERIRLGGPYAVADRDAFYGSGARGYTDYEPLPSRGGVIA